ncbi:jerky protein homolog-like [Anastrepha ludens]|uniref:jerky protein homolog-like n=2 Tax=Anastrepha TaxID=28585 RepID=UPI0023AFF92C|nr:jerky protein homolog-like [Anastrepha ludens]
MDNLSEFKASDGWLRNFKARHGIRELDLCGEKLSADNTAAEKFIEEFKTKIENYDPEFVFNADETGLNWKALPRKTLASKRETSAPGHKVSKDRVTVLTCANSTGNHRLPLLLIGKSKNPRAFKNVKKLPVVYKNQNKAWMTSALFTEWFDDVFIPDVKKYQKKINKKGNVLLLLDNAPTHPSESLLERENGRFKALFLPPNVTSLLQPMDQGIIECMKRLYKKQLLRKLLLADENEEGTLIYHKNINIKDCCYMVADAWTSVKAITLKRAWNKINGISTQQQIQEEKENAELKNNEESDKDTDSMSTENLQNMITKVPGCSECNVEDIEDWLHSDSIDPGFQLLSDDEIIQSTKEESYPVDTEDDNDSTFELEAGPSANDDNEDMVEKSSDSDSDTKDDEKPTTSKVAAAANEIAKTHLTMALIDPGNPLGQMSQEQWKTVELKLLEALFARIYADPDASMPTFEGAGLFSGFKIISKFKYDPSLTWVKESVKKLQGLWVGAALVIVNRSCVPSIPKAKV